MPYERFRLLAAFLALAGCQHASARSTDGVFQFETLDGRITILNLEKSFLKANGETIPLTDCSTSRVFCRHGDRVKLVTPISCDDDFDLIKFGRTINGIEVRGVDSHTGDVALLESSFRQFAYHYNKKRGVTVITILPRGQQKFTAYSSPIEYFAYLRDSKPLLACNSNLR
jgi:hypothetical protein